MEMRRDEEEGGSLLQLMNLRLLLSSSGPFWTNISSSSSDDAINRVFSTSWKRKPRVLGLGITLAAKPRFQFTVRRTPLSAPIWQEMMVASKGVELDSPAVAS